MSQGPFHVIGARVDALRVAYGLRVDVAQLAACQHAAATARRGETMTIAGKHFLVTNRSERPGKRFELRGAIGLVFVGEHEAIVDVAVPYLADHAIADVVAHATRIVRAMCEPGTTIERAEVREIDLCADLAGATFVEADRDAFVTRYRALKGWRSDMARNATGLTLTGLHLGSKPAFFALYDKIGELAQKRGTAAGHAANERARWQANGWNGSGQVWRAEFRPRRGMLRAYGLRNPATLADRIDPAWQAFTRKVLRLVVPNSATRRERCRIDPRWTALQTASLVRAAAAPADRMSTVRQGATMAQGIGTMFSALATCGVPRGRAERGMVRLLAYVRASSEIATAPDRAAVVWTRVGGVP